MVPEHTAGVFSASYRVGAACAAEEATATSAPANRLTHAIMGLMRMIRLRWVDFADSTGGAESAFWEKSS
ncbi:hypothetical protein GCM10027199_03940 [Amycolatopsis magusensis]